MPTGTEIVQELEGVMNLRASQGWDKYWRDCMRYALPSDISYENLLNEGSISKVTGSIGKPYAQTLGKDLYDQTSLWGIERLTAGLISLKTPETSQWHKLDVDDPFGYEADLSEEAWFDKLTRYLFKVRANPYSGFWPSHKAAIRSTTAMGDGFMFMEEKFGNLAAPWTYEFVPLGECFISVDMKGQILRFFRVRKLTAEQIVARWPEAASPKIKTLASTPDGKNTTHTVVHALIPRGELDRRGKIGVRAATWSSFYVDVEAKTIMDESGYWEMPYIHHGWNHSAGRAYSEGPMALALAEIKSLNLMAKNELISAQQAVRPPLATYGDNFTRINLNAGATNPGLVNGDGRLLVQPIMTHTRPDFAQAVLESRRTSVREMLYLNLWQILIERPDMTATEAMLRAQEKGELLGPVGISFNHSLALMVEREIAILARKGAFEQGAALEAPASLQDFKIMPQFKAPLDRMRAMEEVIGAQRTVQGMMEVAAFDPSIMDDLNVRRYSDMLRRGNGAPADLFFTEEEKKDKMQGQQQTQELAQALELAKAGGDAASAMGRGVQDMRAAAGGPAPDVQAALAA